MIHKLHSSWCNGLFRQFHYYQKTRHSVIPAEFLARMNWLFPKRVTLCLTGFGHAYNALKFCGSFMPRVNHPNVGSLFI